MGYLIQTTVEWTATYIISKSKSVDQKAVAKPRM